MEYGIKKTFDIHISNQCKGIAIIWMMFHHLVPYTEFSGGPVLCGIYLPGVLGLTGKACGGIFLVLSGYGLYKSQNHYNSIFQFYSKRLKKIYLTYWIIFDLFTVIGILFFSGSFLYLTADPFTRLENLLYSLSGMQYFIKNSGYMGYNSAWWYIGLCVLLYLLFPVLQKLLDKYPRCFLGGAILLCIFWREQYCSFIMIRKLLQYLPLFAAGMLSAHYRIFERAGEKLAKKPKSSTAVIAGILIICIIVKYYVRNNVDICLQLDCIISLLLLLEVYHLNNVSEGHTTAKILTVLGSYSFEIYLIHLFITNMYTTMYIYSINDAFWMVVVTLCASLLFAVPIQKLTSFLSTRKALLNFALSGLLAAGILLSVYAGC